MGSNKPTATVWRTAEEVAEPLVDSVESDGLDPLRKTLAKYEQKLAYIQQLHVQSAFSARFGFDRTIDFYKAAIESVTNLIWFNLRHANDTSL